MQRRSDLMKFYCIANFMFFCVLFAILRLLLKYQKAKKLIFFLTPARNILHNRNNNISASSAKINDSYLTLLDFIIHNSLS